jgi:hypothetical protein
MSKQIEIYEIECDYYGEFLNDGNTAMHEERAAQWAKGVATGTNLQLKQLAYEEDVFKFRFFFTDGATNRFFYGKQLLKHVSQA